MKFNNKNELIDFIKKQTKIDLKTNQDDYEKHHNENENLLYVKLDRKVKYDIFTLFNKYKIRTCEHLNDYYWIYIKGE